MNTRLTLTCLAITAAACRGDAHEDERNRRFDQHCLLVQIEMQDGLRAALPGLHHDEKIARFFFDQYATTEWREVRFCSPEGADLEDACDRGNDACEAAQFERAIAWMTWFSANPRAVIPAPKP